MKASILIRNATRTSGFSLRSIASSAGVASSTITRIQAGKIEPTLQMVERILHAAGYELRLEVVRRGTDCSPRLGDLADAWSESNGHLKIHWTRWRAFLDYLALHPDRVPEGIYPIPPPAGNDTIDALTAAVGEKLADDAGLPRPTWTSAAPVLDKPFRPAPIRPSLNHDIAPQLAARNVMVDTESLWRRAGAIGV